MTDLEKAARMALEALEMYLNMDTMDESYLLEIDLAPKAITALRRALEQPASGIKQVIELYDSPEQPAQDNTYRYAKSLAEAIFKQHFASDEHYASGRVVWGVNDTVIGILTQIDNMVADMVRRSEQPAQQEPCCFGGIAHDCHAGPGCRIAERLKSANPQARKPLSEVQIATVYWGATGQSLRPQDNALAHKFARAIEAAHGIKGDA